ncbi:MAG: 50S ribosomal protein L17 [Saprospiraceae bacterium]|nr:50S ribosomal protein L17 [Saprospiraceae bacterium]
MRHGKKVNHLGRKVGHRHALMKNLAQALIQHKRINTTLAKAKALRVYIEPLVTKAKTNTTHSRRVVFTYLQSKEAIKELFGPIAEKVGDRPGGYVRVIKTGFRQGDAAEMAMIEFVDFNEVYSAKEEDKGGGRRRRRRKGGSGDSQVAKTREVATETAVEEEEVIEDVAETVEDVVADEPVAEATEEAPETETNEDEEKKTEE